MGTDRGTVAAAKTFDMGRLARLAWSPASGQSAPFAPPSASLGRTEVTMPDDLKERLERMETSLAAMARVLAAQGGQLRVVTELARQILIAVTPEESEREGPSLDELLAQLIMQLRAQSLQLRQILDLLHGRKPAELTKPTQP